MTSLTRWDPFQEMSDFARLVDRMWGAPFFSEERMSEHSSWGLALDVIEHANNFVVKASIPGVNPDDLDVTFTNNTLNIRGELQEDQVSEGEQVHLRERRFGKFSRSITLPTRIDTDHIQADYQAGVLILTLPKVEEARAKRIEVKSGGKPKIFEGKFEKISGKN
jgi:HSP20 family protein